MIEIFGSKIEVVLVAGKEGKGALSPCGECDKEPGSCGQILHGPESVECVKNQQAISRHGNEEAEDVIIENEREL